MKTGDVKWYGLDLPLAMCRSGTIIINESHRFTTRLYSDTHFLTKIPLIKLK